jgi:hypothetical protein
VRGRTEHAATSIVLSRVGGGSGQSGREPRHRTSLALRSQIETVACLDIARRRDDMAGAARQSTCEAGRQVFVKLQALRRGLTRPVSVPRSRVS